MAETRQTYATMPLPTVVAEETLAQMAEFMEFAETHRLTTCPHLRGVLYQMECAATALRAELLAARLTAAREAHNG